MGFFDDIEIQLNILSDEFGLYRPVLDQSVAGVLPSIVKNWNADITLSNNIVTNELGEKKLQESFPSGYDNIIFLVCDALGAYHLREMGSMIWNNMMTKGAVVSSCFPTMTATVMTSLSYGLHPSQHGLVGYNIFNEHLGQIWNALNLRYRDGAGNIKMVLDDAELHQLVAGIPMTDQIKNQADIPVSFFTPDELKPPGLGNILNPFLPRQTYSGPEDAGRKLVGQLNKDIDKQFIALYIGYADHFGHLHGPESEYYREAIRGIEHSINQLLEHPKVKNGSTLIALTSDHGQVQLNHDISYTMDRQEWQKQRENGILLSTSGRVIHAYAEPDKLEKCRDFLDHAVKDKGLIIENKKAMDLAGGETSFSNRMGDYVAIFEDEYIYDVPEIVSLDDYEKKLQGQHGSLTAKELFVPFGIFGGQ